MSGGGYLHTVSNAYITSDNVTSDAIPIKGYNFIGIEVPTFEVGVKTNTANVYVQVANSSSDTFRRVQDIGVYSGNSGIYDWETPSGTGNRIIVCRPAAYFDYMKVEISNSATAGTGDGLQVRVHMSQ